MNFPRNRCYFFKIIDVTPLKIFFWFYFWKTTLFFSFSVLDRWLKFYPFSEISRISMAFDSCREWTRRACTYGLWLSGLCLCFSLCLLKSFWFCVIHAPVRGLVEPAGPSSCRFGHSYNKSPKGTNVCSMIGVKWYGGCLEVCQRPSNGEKLGSIFGDDRGITK